MIQILIEITNDNFSVLTFCACLWFAVGWTAQLHSYFFRDSCAIKILFWFFSTHTNISYYILQNSFYNQNSCFYKQKGWWNVNTFRIMHLKRNFVEVCVRVQLLWLLHWHVVSLYLGIVNYQEHMFKWIICFQTTGSLIV